MMRWLLLCCFALVPRGLHAGEKELPADLAFVPADAVFFAHVRLADVWKSDHVKEWRETVLKAGDKALNGFDRRFFPTPSSLERVTLFLSLPKEMPKSGPEEPLVVVIAASKPIDKENFFKHTLPGAKAEETKRGTLYVDARSRTEVYFINDRTMAFSPPGAVRKVLAMPKPAKGNLTGALQLANSGKVIVIAVNAEALPEKALQEIPPPFQPLAKAKLATLSLDLKHEGQIDLRMIYAGVDQAMQAETAAQEGIKLARVFIDKGRAELEKKVLGGGKPGTLEELPEAAASLGMLGMLNRVEQYLDSSPLKKDGDALHLSFKLPQGGQSTLTTAAFASTLLVPAVQKVRMAAARTQSMNNLKQIGLAMHNYHDATGAFPAAALCDKAGKPLLSWRVAILPYLEHKELYDKFKLDEPWDSEHNKKLLPLMPPVYAVPAAPDAKGETYYRVFVGGGAGFEKCQPVRITHITDGTSNTILAVEAGQSVPWTSPDELAYAPNQPLPRLGSFYGDKVFLALFFDGSVHSMQDNLPAKKLRALITRDGGEVIDP